MPTCTSKASIQNASIGSQAFHKAGVNGMKPAGLTDASATIDAIEFDRQAARQSEAIDGVMAAMPAEATPTAVTDAGTQGAIKQGARMLQRLINAARGTDNRLIEQWERHITEASGTSAGESSWWLNFANGLYRRFQDAGASLLKYGQVYAGSEGKGVNENIIVRDVLNGQRQIAGVNQTFLGYFNDSFNKPLNELARRTGKDARGLGALIGHYASARHALERNPHLRERWEGELLAEQAKDKPDLNKIADIKRDIELFDKHINDDHPPEDVASSGYTNGEAQKMMEQVIKDSGLTREECERLADGLCDVYQKIQLFRAENGLMRNAERMTIPFEKFVPLILPKDNITGFVNDTGVYAPMRFHRFNGMTGKPASAYEAILGFAHKTAAEFAYRDLSQTMLSLAGKAMGKDLLNSEIPLSGFGTASNGLRMYNYGQVYNAKFNGTPLEQRLASVLLDSQNGGGLVGDVPRIDPKTGELKGYERMLVQFEDGWRDEKNGFTGAELNKALMQSIRKGTELDALARATGFMGQFYTRLNPLFSPVNTVRDFIERGSNLMGMELYSEDGRRISGMSILPRYLAASGEAASILGQVMRGTLEAGSQLAQWWRDYVQDGLHQEYTRGKNRVRLDARDILNEQVDISKKPITELLNKPEYKGLRKALEASGATGKDIIENLDKWNDYFNNIAPLSEYIAMRRAGTSRESAANAVLSQMNLYQQGTWTKALQRFFPFVKPSIQSFTAAMRTLGSTDAAGKFHLNKKGIAGVIGMTAAYSMLYSGARASLGTDPETGIDRIDQLSIDELQRGLPLGIKDGTSFLRFPTGYGLIQSIIAMTVGSDRVRRGLMSGEEAAAETIFAMVKNALPANWPEFRASEHPIAWIAQAFTPTLAQPMTESISQINRYGRPVTYADPNSDKAMALQGGLNTPRAYHTIAKAILNTTGVDLAPEQVRSIIRGYAIGPMRFITSLLENSPTARSSRSESATQTLGPFLTSMGASLLYGNTYDTGKAMFYQAYDKYQQRIRSSGIEITSKANNTQEKKDAFLREQLPKAGFSDAEIEDFILLKHTLSDIRKYNSKSADELKPLWQADESEALMRGLKEYAETTGAMYDDAVRALHYYRSIR